MNDILLVDDEQAVLQNLSAALDWSEYGFVNLHMAKSAEEAFIIMKNNKIDLVILDIQMPKITGLEMLKTIRTKYPDIHCVLISAYSKFEYAKEALQLNVENYLLKPIDINELRETVAHAVENIMKASASSHNLFERNLLERWLHGRISNDELLEHSQYTRYNVLMRRYYAVIIHLTNTASTALHALASALTYNFDAYMLNKDKDNGILLFGGYDVSEIYIKEAAMPLVKAYPCIQIICGSCAMGNGGVSKSFADADYTLQYARLAGYTGYLSFDQIDWNLLSPTLLSELNDILQLTPSENQIRLFTDKLVNPIPNLREDYCSLYAHICLTAMNILETSHHKNLSLPPLTAPYSQERFENAVTKAIFLINNSKQQRMQNLSPIIQRVVRYIHDNMSSSISIKYFCEQSNMNPTYIGRLFREDLGMYFSEYVSELRINKAKLLLENTSYSVSDIARQVGMYDVSYFVQFFKKNVRISPMKYRQFVLQNKEYPHDC